MSDPYISDPQLAYLVRLLGSLEEGMAAFELIKMTGARTLTQACAIAVSWHGDHVKFTNEQRNIS